jgi:hypothetical protein
MDFKAFALQSHAVILKLFFDVTKADITIIIRAENTTGNDAVQFAVCVFLSNRWLTQKESPNTIKRLSSAL